MRKFNVNVNGSVYSVEVEEIGGSSDTASSPVVSAPVATQQPAPMPKPAVAGGKAVTSPLPGTILKINFANGAKVKKGDKLLIIEAMKMENDICSPCDGVVNYVVSQGASVVTGDALASIN